MEGKHIATETLKQEKPGRHFQRFYPIPAELTNGKKKITVRLQAQPENVAGGLFGCQTLRAPEQTTSSKSTTDKL